MALYTVFAAAPLGFSARTFLSPAALRTATAAASITFTNPDGTRFVLTGSGFAFNAGGQATAGTISAVTFTNAAGTTSFASITGLSTSLASFLAAWTGGSDPLALLLAGADTLTGSANADILFAGDGTDTINAGEGHDLIQPGRGADTANGGGGADILSYASDYTDPAINKGITLSLATGSLIDPWGGKDSFTGIEGAQGTRHGDTLTGDAGDNLIEGLDGADTMVGGAGYDTVSYLHDADFGGTAGVLVSLRDNVAGDGFGSYDSVTGFEAAVGTNQADTLVGGDTPLAGGRTYTLTGMAGNDTLIAGTAGMLAEPGAGADSLLGDSGFDEVSYAEYTGKNGATFDFAAGTIADPYGSTDTLSGIEAARMTANADSFIGSAAANSIAGLAGADSIDGGAGLDEARYDLDATHGGKAGVYVDLAAGLAIDGFGATDTLASIEAVRGTAGTSPLLAGVSDLLLGSAGADSFRGLAGTDYIDGRAGVDTIDHSGDAASGGAAGVFVSLADGYAVDGFGTPDIVLNIENIRGTSQAAKAGAAFGDVLIGSTAANSFQGLGASDYIDGGAGSDTADYATDAAAGGTAGVLVDLATGFAVDGFGSYDWLVSIENIIGTDRPQPTLASYSDVLLGSAADNTLDGRGGLDVLSGAAGNDTLIGGAGSDQLTGGDGADAFVIDSAALVGGDYDQITDFLPGTDSIRAPLALQGKVAVIAGSGQVLLLYDTGSGLYALGIAGATSTAQVQAALTFV